MMTNLDKTNYARIIRQHYEAPYVTELYVKKPECKLVMNGDNKLCLFWMAQNGEGYITDPVVSIEKIENGCRIVTFCGMIYKLEET
jgi:hypothetical protein